MLTNFQFRPQGSINKITQLQWVAFCPKQVGILATWPLPSGGVPNASERGKESAVAHKCEDWQHNLKPYHVEGSPMLHNEGQKQ